jgi:membrane protease YdiL (CAAX protease family)
MPEHANALAVSLELTLLLLGLALLWRLVFSPAARAHRPSSVLGPWEAPVSDFFIFLWLIFFGGVVVQLSVSWLLRFTSAADDARLLFVGTAFHAGMLGGIAVYRLVYDRHRGRPTATSVHPVVSGAATFLVAIPIVTVISLVWQFGLDRCGLPAEPQDLIGIFAHTKSRALLLFLTVVATVVAPVTEELIFRAGFFRYVRTRLPRWAALLAPACLFAALHQNLASFAPLVALGIIFSLAYERTGRIGTSMVAHALFNLNTIALILSGATA